MQLRDKNLYYVGGVVRDSILGIPSFDTDLCYEGDAIEFAQKSGLNIIKTNPEFGTVRVLIDEKEVDIASTRKETYPQKGHLPRVTDIGCPLKEDLKRRDFSINSMAKRTTDGEIIDYFNGLADIENKNLRVLHEKSFIDDPTRIIRGLKFSVRFNFELSDDTKQFQREYLDNVNYDMSYHRIRKELTETFNLNSPIAYEKFIEQKIYKLIDENISIPKVRGNEIKNAINKYQIKNNIWFIYISLFLDEKNILKLYPTREEKRILKWVERLNREEAGNNTPKESIIIRELLNNAL